jgi:hypothetical protein
MAKRYGSVQHDGLALTSDLQVTVRMSEKLESESEHNYFLSSSLCEKTYVFLVV